MTTRLLAAMLLLAVVVPTAGAAPTKEESACQQQAAKQLGTAGLKRIKCLVACDKKAQKGKVPAADCLPPYGGTTRSCVDAVQAKASEAIARKCAPDCPECWAGGDCAAHVDGLLFTVESTVDDVVPLVSCDDATSPDGLTKAETKGRQKAAVAVGVYALATEKCLAKCRAGEASGKVPAGSCEGLDATDPKTLACLFKAADKAFDALENPKLDVPECLADELPFAVPFLSGIIHTLDGEIFCASPSGAFVAQNDIFE